MADLWTPLKYGWSHVMWLQIEGIPFVWSQTTVTPTAPSGYNVSDTLVVGDSARIGAVIDRDKGIGAGFPLTFTLLDSTELAALLAKPTAQTWLTQDLASNDTPANVDDTTDFDASGTIYVGKEQITYSAKAATTFTLSARGVTGYAYPHDSRSGAALVTDVPRYWRGRFVTLYASPIDPTGYMPGVGLEDDALVVWRGYLDGEPKRSGDGDGFVFEALPLDRMLARPLASTLSGTVSDSDLRFEIGSTQCRITLDFLDSAGASLGASPYQIEFDAMSSASPGDFVSLTEFNASAVTAFAAAITTYSAGTYVNSLEIYQALTGYVVGAATVFNKGDWVPIVRLNAAAGAPKSIKMSSNWCGIESINASSLQPTDHSFYPAGTIANDHVPLNIAYAWSPYSMTGGNGSGAKPKLPMVSVLFDSGNPGTLPDQGQIEIGGNLYTYKDGVSQTTTAAKVVFKSLAMVGPTSQIDSLVKASVTVSIQDSGTLADTARRMIHSSGETNLRSNPYDALLGRVGYGIPEAFVDDDEIGNVLGGFGLSGINLLVSPDNKGLDGTLGGLLALSERALVVSDDGTSDALLTAVYTSAGVGGYAAQLTDADVLSYPSAAVSTQNVESANVVRVDLEIGDADYAHIIETDTSRVAFEGAREEVYSIPAEDDENIVLASASWALGRITGDQHAALLSIDVVPWLSARIGDALDLTLTHPNIWSFADSAVGYTGRARVIGRQVQLSTGQQRLTLLIYGQSVGTAICLSAPVVAFDHATAPTTIDIATGFFKEMDRNLTATGSDIRLLLYAPGTGTEVITQGYTISAAVITGGVCRLTVASVIGAGTLVAGDSYLSLPETANADNYQKTWAHADDGGQWT